LRDFQSTSLATGAGADANGHREKERSLAPDKLDVASTYDENREVIVRLRAGLLIVALVAVVAGRPTVLQAHHSEKETVPVGAKLTVEGGRAR